LSLLEHDKKNEKKKKKKKRKRRKEEKEKLFPWENPVALTLISDQPSLHYLDYEFPREGGRGRGRKKKGGRRIGKKGEKRKKKRKEAR